MAVSFGTGSAVALGSRGVGDASIDGLGMRYLNRLRVFFSAFVSAPLPEEALCEPRVDLGETLEVGRGVGFVVEDEPEELEEPDVPVEPEGPVLGDVVDEPGVDGVLGFVVVGGCVDDGEGGVVGRCGRVALGACVGRAPVLGRYVGVEGR